VRPCPAELGVEFVNDNDDLSYDTVYGLKPVPLFFILTRPPPSCPHWTSLFTLTTDDTRCADGEVLGEVLVEGVTQFACSLNLTSSHAMWAQQGSSVGMILSIVHACQYLSRKRMYGVIVTMLHARNHTLNGSCCTIFF
jgi:hypothetical protein